MSDNGWNEYEKLVLSSIGNLDKKMDRVLEHELPEVRVELAKLKEKAGIWGILGGVLAALSVLAAKMAIQ